MKYSTEIQKAEFDESGLAIKAGWAQVYLCDSMTREYVRASLDNVPLGGSVVADAYLDKPELPTKSDIAIVRSADEKLWLHIADHRGKTAYNTSNRQQVVINFIGDLPVELTLLEPKTEFDAWNGKAWVTDTDAQKVVLIAQAEQEKAQRLTEAEQSIIMLERKVRLGMATDEEVELLKQWEIYSVKVENTDTSLAPDINFPAKPE
ncbi:tail fiber assembly protein [Providencia alcalifaciens]|uniref:tail fiber assembly protein n=1 Tax=Providencia alcalifaciens TaxID=126385 RepID=UPI000D96BEA0|nr:tail fiber assembly protein [Providencia alcalifaciens]SPY70781.1 Caudovirales tail fibre assembly protein [Providencia alcalifaciens]